MRIMIIGHAYGYLFRDDYAHITLACRDDDCLCGHKAWRCGGLDAECMGIRGTEHEAHAPDCQSTKRILSALRGLAGGFSAG